MVLPHESELTLTHTLRCLVQLQKELCKLLRECAIGEPVVPRYSLFSSKRVFRTDELNLGLRGFKPDSVFSAN